MVHQLPLQRVSLFFGFILLCACAPGGGGGSAEQPSNEAPGVQISAPNPTSASPIPSKIVPNFGTEQSFDLATWNIENYPKSMHSKGQVSSILKKLDLDLIAVEEISDKDSLDELVETLPGYAGILSEDSNQNVGFIYRKSELEVMESRELFEREGFAFPRTPLLVRFKVISHNSLVDEQLIAIVVHLKAFGDDKSQTRREKANLLLEQLVRDIKTEEPEVRVLVMGDFNDRMDDEQSRTVFNPWFTSNYRIATEPLAHRGDYSFFSSNLLSLIDHVISSEDLSLEEPHIPKLQQVVPNYEATVSDHLPVMTRMH